jgi:hypothetical protein
MFDGVGLIGNLCLAALTELTNPALVSSQTTFGLKQHYTTFDQRSVDYHLMD